MKNILLFHGFLLGSVFSECFDDAKYSGLCPLYKKYDYCDKYADWMSVYCPESCGKCSSCSCQVFVQNTGCPISVLIEILFLDILYIQC